MVDNVFSADVAKRQKEISTGQSTPIGEVVEGKVVKSREEVEEEVEEGTFFSRSGSKVSRSRTQAPAPKPTQAPKQVSMFDTPKESTIFETPKPLSSVIIESQIQSARQAKERGVFFSELKKERKTPLGAIEEIGFSRGEIQVATFETGSPISIRETKTFKEDSKKGVKETFIEGTSKKALLIQRDAIKQIDKFAESQKEPFFPSVFDIVTGKKSKVTEVSERIIKGTARGTTGVVRDIIRSPGKSALIAGGATILGGVLTLLPEPVTTVAGLSLLGVVGATEGIGVATSEDKAVAIGESVGRITTIGLALSPFVKGGSALAKVGKEIVFPQKAIDVVGRGFDLPKGTQPELLSQRLSAKELTAIGKRGSKGGFKEFIETTKIVQEARPVAEAKSFDFFGRPDFSQSAVVERQVTETLFASPQKFSIKGIITEKGLDPFRELIKVPGIIGKKGAFDVGFRTDGLTISPPSVKPQPSSLFGFSDSAFAIKDIQTPSIFLGVPGLTKKPSKTAQPIGFQLADFGDVRGLSFAKQLKSTKLEIPSITPTGFDPKADVIDLSISAPIVDVPAISTDLTSFDSFASEPTSESSLSIPAIPIGGFIDAPIGGFGGGFLFGGSGGGFKIKGRQKKVKRKATKSVSQSIFGGTAIGAVKQKGRSEITGLTLRT